MENLYTINNRIDDILNMEEFTEENQKQFEELQMQFDEKVENILKYMKNLEADAIKYDNEIERLLDRKNRLSKKASNLKTYLDKILQKQWIEKQEFWSFLVSYRKTAWKVVVDESVLDKRYIKVKTTESIDKALIKEDLKKWLPIKGAYIEPWKSLQIK